MKQKKRKLSPQEKRMTMIKNASWMVVAATSIQLGTEEGFRQKRIRKLIIGYWAGMKKMHDINRKKMMVGKSLTEIDALAMAQPLCTKNIFHIFRERMEDPYMRWANSLAMTCMIITLNTMYKWGQRKMDRWIEGYIALIDEVRNPGQPTGTKDIYRWAEELTGVDVRKELV